MIEVTISPASAIEGRYYGDAGTLSFVVNLSEAPVNDFALSYRYLQRLRDPGRHTQCKLERRDDITFLAGETSKTITFQAGG